MHRYHHRLFVNLVIDCHTMHKHEVIIRPATSHDAPHLARLAQELAASEGLQSLATTDTILRDGFDEPQRCRYLVACDQQHGIVGMVMFYHGYDLQSAAHGLHLGDIIVSNTHQRHGIGSQLFHALCRTARQEHCAWISWTLLPSNRPARRFYQKMGAVSIEVEFMALGQQMMYLHASA
jgi:ribosomal protein S18 acetylase RimI-like enzyme